MTQTEQAGFLRDTPPVGGVHGALVVTGDASGGTGATEATLADLRDRTPDETGTWGYNAGVSGTLTLSGSKRLLGIAASAPSTGPATFTINAGNTITIPTGKSVQFEPLTNLIDPALVFTGTDSYIVEYLT